MRVDPAFKSCEMTLTIRKPGTSHFVLVSELSRSTAVMGRMVKLMRDLFYGNRIDISGVSTSDKT